MVHVFIVDPEKCARDYYYTLQDRLSRIPDLTYYVFTTGVAGDETELAHTVETIFEGEQLRIYSCGNITTARNILDGLRDLSRIEFAIVPQRFTEYLVPFGDMEKFTDIERMIDGTIVHTDYIKTNHGLALNSVAFGLEAFNIKCYDSLSALKVFGRMLPWVVANFHTLFASPNHVYSIDLDDVSMVRKTTSLYLGNVPIESRFIQWSDNTDITDGVATYNFIYKSGFFGRLFFFINKIRKTSLADADAEGKVRLTGNATLLKVRDINIRPIFCSLDGKLISASNWKIEVVKQGLRLVVPREVTS